MRSALLAVLLAAGLAAAKDVPAELGRAFRLEKGQTAVLDGGKAALKIVRFVDSPCPKGARCVWSGRAVIRELSVAGKVVRDEKASPYDVAVASSDYRTYASFVVRKRAKDVLESTP